MTIVKEIGVPLVLEDVSSERKLSSELEYRANHDAMTGAYNRFYFDRRLAELTSDVSRSRREHPLCYIDLDQFKVVNDTCGHSSGDRLLCELTESLHAKLRSGDVLARLGGDEFGILICDCSRDNAIGVAEKIYHFFQHFVFEHDGKAFQVQASIGFVEINTSNCDLKTVMSAADPTLPGYIEEQMIANEVCASRFWFEITETAAISHFSNAVTLIRGIQKLGAKVALDDFGSGLSSFAYLRNLPVDVLKIDGQFVKDVHDSDVAREMVRAIDHVGKSMGIKTVAEFVEDENVLQVLATIGVDYAQGYFIARPCPLAEVFHQDVMLKAS